jgi:hypothetical protein
VETGGTLIPARLSVSVRADAGPLVCALSVADQEFRQEIPLLAPGLLDRHRIEVDYATQGLRPRDTVLPELRRALVRAVPRPGREWLRRIIAEAGEHASLAVEVMINDSLVLERYPWELLAHPGLLVSRDSPVIIWRSVRTARRARNPSSAVLLVGSASFDAISTNAPEEISHLAWLFEGYRGASAYPFPGVTFNDFVQRLAALTPAVVHIVTHGNLRSFQFQQDAQYSKSHYDIPSQELSGYLAESSTASLIVLNACDSANSWQEVLPIARQIATDGSLAVIGMSAEIPNLVGAEFSEHFFLALLAGASMLEAFGRAARAVQHIKKFSYLWSVPVMYAPPESNVILFPADPVGRMRLQLQELHSQLRQLETDVAAFIENIEIGRNGTVPGLGTTAIRLAYIRDLIDAIEPSTVPLTVYFGPIAQLASVRASARRKLAEPSSSLGSLRDLSQSRAERLRVLRSVIAATREQARAFAEVERNLAPSFM